jgi:hypothetical protein
VDLTRDGSSRSKESIVSVPGPILVNGVSRGRPPQLCEPPPRRADSTLVCLKETDVRNARLVAAQQAHIIECVAVRAESPVVIGAKAAPLDSPALGIEC